MRHTQYSTTTYRNALFAGVALLCKSFTALDHKLRGFPVPRIALQPRGSVAHAAAVLRLHTDMQSSSCLDSQPACFLQDHSDWSSWRAEQDFNKLKWKLSNLFLSHLKKISCRIPHISYLPLNFHINLTIKPVYQTLLKTFAVGQND